MDDHLATSAGEQPANLTAQLTTSAPEVKTYQALIVFGMQQDFLATDAALPVDTSTGFVQRIVQLVPKFRDRAGHVMWVRSELESEATADAFIGAGKTVKKFFGSLDKELDRTMGLDYMMPNAKYNTSEFADEIKPLVLEQSDHIIDKRYCSAFTSASFQMTLHQNLIGDVFVCGAIGEITIYAFARDAASRGLRLHVIEDCLGYRNRSRNEYAIRRMAAHMNANRISSDDIHRELDDPMEQTVSASDLADQLTDAMVVDSPRRLRAAAPVVKRRPVMLKQPREHLLLPSGELKKKASRTKIYSRKSAKARAAGAAADPPAESHPAES